VCHCSSSALEIFDKAESKKIDMYAISFSELKFPYWFFFFSDLVCDHAEHTMGGQLETSSSSPL